MQSHARVVVVGGGCVGVNILYSLANRGWTDVCLLERTELTAGSTWHAAGLIPIYSFSYKFGRLIKKTIEIYESLEKETGQDIQIWAARSIAKVFDKLKLPYERTVKTNAPSFTKNFLQEHIHPVVNKIAKAREINKAHTTFIDTIIKHEIGRASCRERV